MSANARCPARLVRDTDLSLFTARPLLASNAQRLRHFAREPPGLTALYLYFSKLHMSPYKKLGYLLFLLPTAVLGAMVLGARRFGHWELFGFLPLLVVFVVIPLVDLVVGVDEVNPNADEEAALRADSFYSLLLIACVPVQLATLGVGVYVVTHAPLGALGVIGWTLSFGIASSVLAITAGHELIHRHSRGMQRLGGVLLATVGYGSFKVEHVLGHHVHVATPEDPSTARRGDNVYAFVARALIGNVRRAYRLERAHANRRAETFRWFRSEVIGWAALTLLLLGGAAVFAGAAGAAFFAGQALVAVTLLEVINFVEHYGLARRPVGSRGGYQPTTPAHSWNSNYLVSNLLLFQLQRHSDHHANAARPYPVLRTLTVSPQLPAGYPTMVLMALVPPLYRAVMDRRLAAA